MISGLATKIYSRLITLPLIRKLEKRGLATKAAALIMSLRAENLPVGLLKEVSQIETELGFGETLRQLGSVLKPWKLLLVWTGIDLRAGWDKPTGQLPLLILGQEEAGLILSGFAPDKALPAGLFRTSATQLKIWNQRKTHLLDPVQAYASGGFLSHYPKFLLTREVSLDQIFVGSRLNNLEQTPLFIYFDSYFDDFVGIHNSPLITFRTADQVESACDFLPYFISLL